MKHLSNALYAIYARSAINNPGSDLGRKLVVDLFRISMPAEIPMLTVIETTE
jgi:hypothetical protein